MAVVANSTSSAPVYRADGLRLYGLDAEIELKMRAKRDPEVESELERWLCSVLRCSLEPPGDLSESLKSGIYLCKLINALKPDTIKLINLKPIPLMEMENLNFYLKACWKLGLPSGDLFVASDLYEKKGLGEVWRNLLALGRLAANLRTFKGPYLSLVPPPRASVALDPNAPPPAKPKTWVVPDLTRGPTYITDLERQHAEAAAAAPPGSDAALLHAERQRSARFEAELAEARENVLRLTRTKLALEERIAQLLQRSGTPAATTSTPAATQPAPAATPAAPGDARKAREREWALQAELDALRAELAAERTARAKELRGRDEQIASLRASLAAGPSGAAPSGGVTAGGGERSQDELSDDNIWQIRECVAGILVLAPGAAAAEAALSERAAQVRELLEKDAGRRCFTKELKKAMKRAPSLLLSDAAFELLLYLFNTLLTQQDRATAKDLIATKLLMTAATSISRLAPARPSRGSSDGPTFDYLLDYVRGYDIWRNLGFWEEYFWDEMAAQFRDMPADDVASWNHTHVPELCSAFAYTMHFSWNLPADSIRSFVEGIARRLELGERDMTTLGYELGQFEAARGSADRFKALQTELMKREERASGKGSLVKRSTLTSLQQAAQPSPTAAHEHAFIAHNHLSAVARCYKCKKSIWSGAQQVLQCTVCGCCIHKKCK